jgi:hypothetical protein
MPASVTNLADSHRPQSLTPQVDIRSPSSIRAIRAIRAIRGPPSEQQVGTTNLTNSTNPEKLIPNRETVDKSQITK